MDMCVIGTYCRLHTVLDETFYEALPIHPNATEAWLGDINEYMWRKHVLPGVSDVAKHISSIQDSARGRWNRCKLMVVGQGRAGKSATIRTL